MPKRTIFVSDEFELLQTVSELNTKWVLARTLAIMVDCKIPHQFERRTKNIPIKVWKFLRNRRREMYVTGQNGQYLRSKLIILGAVANFYGYLRKGMFGEIEENRGTKTQEKKKRRFRMEG